MGVVAHEADAPADAGEGAQAAADFDAEILAEALAAGGVGHAVG